MELTHGFTRLLLSMLAEHIEIVEDCPVVGKTEGHDSKADKGADKQVHAMLL